jgi:CubicO group peptidase (beta-lactamase class C family)
LGLLRAAVDAGTTPGLVASVRQEGRVIYEVALGLAEVRPRVRPTGLGVAYDLASLTKVLLTTPLALAMAAEGRLDLDAPLSEILDDAPRGVSAAHCLSHSSGLPAWRPLFETVVREGLAWGAPATRERVFRMARTTRVEAPPGARHVYSDLGFLLLGAALEAAGGDRLDRLWESRVRAPGRLDLRLGWPDAAATEDCPVRKRVVVGEVHDLNAAVMGGIAPHAGLFGTADAVTTAGWRALQIAGGEAGREAARLQQRAFTEVGPGSHRLGWDGVSPEGSSAGSLWPRDGVGHLGFTGTSLWLAPREGLSVALLTNRVHPDIEGGAVPGAPVSARLAALRVLRPAFHDAVTRVCRARSAAAPGAPRGG